MCDLYRRKINLFDNNKIQSDSHDNKIATISILRGYFRQAANYLPYIDQRK
jgi:hypothetical protein